MYIWNDFRLEIAGHTILPDSTDYLLENTFYKKRTD